MTAIAEIAEHKIIEAFDNFGEQLRLDAPTAKSTAALAERVRNRLAHALHHTSDPTDLGSDPHDPSSSSRDVQWLSPDLFGPDSTVRTLKDLWPDENSGFGLWMAFALYVETLTALARVERTSLGTPEARVLRGQRTWRQAIVQRLHQDAQVPVTEEPQEEEDRCTAWLMSLQKARTAPRCEQWTHTAFLVNLTERGPWSEGVPPTTSARHRVALQITYLLRADADPDAVREFPDGQELKLRYLHNPWTQPKKEPEKSAGWQTLLQPSTGTGARKLRITGESRTQLAQDMKRRYDNGESIRAIAGSTGRSYGFVHRLLCESGVKLRGRGSAAAARAKKRAG